MLASRNSGTHNESSGLGQVSFNWHGSAPVMHVDYIHEPNFRHFDMGADMGVPDEDMMNQVLKVEEGEAHWGHRYSMINVRAAPVIFSAIPGAMFMNYFVTRFHNKTNKSMKWGFWRCYAFMICWNNLTKWYGRERMFVKDWRRNQHYSQQELRHERDHQRVREAMYASKFQDDPLAEYRIKQWEVAERFA